MSAEIHQLPDGPGEPPRAASGSVYLDAYLAPFRQWLERDTVTEIIVNRPGEVWIEDRGHPGMQRIRAREIDDKLVQRLAEQVARVSHQGSTASTRCSARRCPPRKAARRRASSSAGLRDAQALGDGHPPPPPARPALDAYDTGPLRPAEEPAMPDPAEQPVAFLRAAIAARKTILISGGTSTGKTTFLNAMLGEIPAAERVVLVEDTPELRLPGANGVGLVAVKGELGEAKVTANELLQSALRLRPDRIVLGELRGAESVSFLRAINTGHPGSFSTIHANSLRGALEQLALMVMQTGIGLTRLRHHRLRLVGHRRHRPTRPARGQAPHQRHRPKLGAALT
jgi:type IV secretion system protein VirB11